MRQDGEYWDGESRLVLDESAFRNCWKLQVLWKTRSVGADNGRWEDLSKEDTAYVSAILALGLQTPLDHRLASSPQIRTSFECWGAGTIHILR